MDNYRMPSTGYAARSWGAFLIITCGSVSTKPTLFEFPVNTCRINYYHNKPSFCFSSIPHQELIFTYGHVALDQNPVILENSIV